MIKKLLTLCDIIDALPTNTRVFGLISPYLTSHQIDLLEAIDIKPWGRTPAHVRNELWSRLDAYYTELQTIA